MAKKVLGGQDTINRITNCWQEVSSNPADRPTVKEFTQRVGIGPAAFYRYYPEWAEKVRMRRDESLKNPRRLSPKAKRSPQKAAEVEAITLIDRLRTELKATRQELQAVKKDRDRWARQAQELDQLQEVNARLRGIMIGFENLLTKHIDSAKAQAIIVELEKKQSRIIQIVEKG